MPAFSPDTDLPTDNTPRRHALLLESMGEGIFGIDITGACTFINRAALDMLGFADQSAVLGRNMHALIHHSHSDGRHYPDGECPIYNAFRQGMPCRIDDEMLWRADGTGFAAEYASHAIVDHGTVRGAVVTFVDISARKHAETLLRASHDELEQRVAQRTTQLRELAHHLEEVRETERKRIAREIHDELGSLLVALKMDVNWLGRRLGDATQKPALQAKCTRMGGLVDTAVDAVGRIITDLRPSILDHQGLWAALEWQAQEFQLTCSDHCRVDFKIFISHGVAPPEGGLAIAVFRIFQELLSNVARHAQARRVEIRLDVDAPPDPVLYLQCRDDGVGMTAEAMNRPHSYGVMGMRERAAQFGGRLRIESQPGHGTTVRLVMPLEITP